MQDKPDSQTRQFNAEWCIISVVLDTSCFERWMHLLWSLDSCLNRSCLYNTSCCFTMTFRNSLFRVKGKVLVCFDAGAALKLWNSHWQSYSCLYGKRYCTYPSLLSYLFESLSHVTNPQHIYWQPLLFQWRGQWWLSTLHLPDCHLLFFSFSASVWLWLSPPLRVITLAHK